MPKCSGASYRTPSDPKLLAGYAVAGVCLLRLESVRPRFMPPMAGVSSENAAHRVAVQWEDGGKLREGVYIPRRDSSSLINRLIGGRLFPGEHHPATFDVRDGAERLELAMRSKDGAVRVYLGAKRAERLPSSSRFASLEEASAFFAAGTLGYSATHDGGRLQGVTFHVRRWRVQPLEVEDVFSSYFGDPTRFPPGSVEFDCALLMRDVDHGWYPEPDLYADRA